MAQGRRPLWKVNREREEAMRRETIRSWIILGLVVLAVVILIITLRSCSHKKDKPADASESTVQSALPAVAAPEPDSDPRPTSSGAGRSASPRPTPTSTPTPKPLKEITDPLLVLVNEDNPCPADWKTDLVSISEEEKIDSRVYDDLMAMFRAAEGEGLSFWIASGYRSPEDQQDILNLGVQLRVARGMTEEEAKKDALRTIQRPGCSEHHTGLAVDLNTVSQSFEETAEYRWLCAHAAEYGFIQRYAGDKAEITGIDNESWHYRYVGKEHAQAMAKLGLCLEEYIDYLRTAA